MNNTKSARRSPEDEALLAQAKALLMERGLTEAQAHRWLQKRSMDSGARLVDTARQVLEEA